MLSVNQILYLVFLFGSVDLSYKIFNTLLTTSYLTVSLKEIRRKAVMDIMPVYVQVEFKGRVER
jgi:hypothetical protein